MDNIVKQFKLRNVDVCIGKTRDRFVVSLADWGVGASFPSVEVAERVVGVMLAASDTTMLTEALRQYEMVQATLDGRAQVETLEDDGQVVIYTNLKEDGHDENPNGFPERLVPLEDDYNDVPFASEGYWAPDGY